MSSLLIHILTILLYYRLLQLYFIYIRTREFLNDIMSLIYLVTHQFSYQITVGLGFKVRGPRTVTDLTIFNGFSNFYTLLWAVFQSTTVYFSKSSQICTAQYLSHINGRCTNRRSKAEDCRKSRYTNIKSTNINYGL